MFNKKFFYIGLFFLSILTSTWLNTNTFAQGNCVGTCTRPNSEELRVPPAEIPQRVYRVDRRTPEIIFNEGFRAYGDNTVLRQHLDGTSCNTGDHHEGRNPDSAFIATTTARQNQNTHNILDMIAGEQRQVGETLYMYIIRPSSNFYSAYYSMRSYLHTGGASGTGWDYIRFLENLRDIAADEEEWVAEEGIERDQIQGVEAYRLTRLEPTRWERVQNLEIVNPYYNTETPPQANNLPYTRINEYDPPHLDSDHDRIEHERNKRSIDRNTYTGYIFFIKGTGYTSCFGDSHTVIEAKKILSGKNIFLSLISTVLPVQ